MLVMFAVGVASLVWMAALTGVMRREDDAGGCPLGLVDRLGAAGVRRCDVRVRARRLLLRDGRLLATCAPTVGEHTDEILSELLSLSETDIQTPGPPGSGREPTAVAA